MSLEISRFIIVCSIFMATAFPFRAGAQPTVSPGQFMEFTSIDGDGIGCRVGTHEVGCIALVFSGTGSPSAGIRAPGVSIDIPDERRLSAGYNRLVTTTVFPIPPLSVPQYASASTYNDFSVLGPANHVVDAQISVTFDGVSEVLGGGAFLAQMKISLGVSDITDGEPGVGISSLELFTMERSNEQGFTDVTVASERQVLVGETSSFVVKLRSARTYRLTFGVEVMGEGILAGLTGFIVGHAGWQSLSVLLDGGPDASVAAASVIIEELIAKIEQLQAQMDAMSVKLDRLDVKMKAGNDRK